MIWIRDYVKKFELRGSESQIKWAQALRARRVEAIIKIGKKEIARVIAPRLSPEVLKSIGCQTPLEASQLMSAIIINMLSESSCAWWIKTRDMPPLEGLSDACDDVVERFKIEKPWNRGVYAHD